MATREVGVVEAEHGEEGLRHLRSPKGFCLILLDLFMPVMNRWKFREEQLRDPQIASIPIIVEGMVKPIRIERLLELVATLC